MSLARWLGRGAAATLDRLATQTSFARAQSLGPNVRVLGRVHVANEGNLFVGKNCVFVSTPAPIHILLARGASLAFGPSCLIESGATFRVAGRVAIGAGVRIGRGAILDDASGGEPVVVGDGAWLEDGAVVLGGAQVGPHASYGPKQASASSSPARTEAEAAAPVPLGPNGSDLERRVGDVVVRVVPSARGIDRSGLLADLSGWDSLAALRILVALEKEFGVILPGDTLAERPTVATVASAIAGRLAVGAEAR